MTIKINRGASKFRIKGICLIALIAFLFIFRVYYGAQTNFSHKDYFQIYLIGLEDALTDYWSYWGPDVVWSKTRLPGAMQGLLAGVPLKLTSQPIAPLIMSNIISAIGLLLLAFYAKRRFPKISIYFLISLFLVFQFGLLNGAVLLNTTYLFLSGALLFVSVFELFVYSENHVFKNRNIYFFLIGFALLFTYQLHLTWVMILPFISVLLILEWRANVVKWWKPLVYLTLGSFLAGLTFFPTLISFPEAIFNEASGNVVFEPARALRVPEVFIRYIGMAAFDIDFDKNVIELAHHKSKFVYILLWITEILNYVLMGAIIIVPFFIKKTVDFNRTLFLFVLTLLMALFLFALSNKHLSTRTYILLYPIPLWISLYVYNYLMKFKVLKIVLFAMLFIMFSTFLSIGIANHNNQYSFKSEEKRIRKAIETKDPYEFRFRRNSIMDEYR